jgi:hypothetical protein
MSKEDEELLRQKYLKTIIDKIEKDIYPSKYNKMFTNYWYTSFNYPLAFNPTCLAIYSYMTFWSNGKEIKTTDKVISIYTGCSIRTVKRTMKILIMFGLIKLIKKGNGFSGKRSIYSILGIEEGKSVRKHNADKIMNLLKGKNTLVSNCPT